MSLGISMAERYTAMVIARPSQGSTLDIQMAAYSKLSLSRVFVRVISSAKIGSYKIELSLLSCIYNMCMIRV